MEMAITAVCQITDLVYRKLVTLQPCDILYGTWKKKLLSTNVRTPIGQLILARTYAPCMHPYITRLYIYAHKEYYNTAQRCRSQERFQLFDRCRKGAKALLLALLRVLFLH